tara:strand:- start:1677 stop:1958 length:282 start_codon:yes stop_codon:yes gene_type:complete
MGMCFAKSTIKDNNILLIEKNNSITYSLEGGLGVGYASKKIIFGTEFTFNVNTYHEDDVNAIVNDKVYGFIYFKYRFDTPDFIAKTYDRFANK